MWLFFLSNREKKDEQGNVLGQERDTKNKYRHHTYLLETIIHSLPTQTWNLNVIFKQDTDKICH